jgi:hypothetical protein
MLSGVAQPGGELFGGNSGLFEGFHANETENKGQGSATMLRGLTLT